MECYTKLHLLLFITRKYTIINISVGEVRVGGVAALGPEPGSRKLAPKIFNTLYFDFFQVNTNNISQ